MIVQKRARMGLWPQIEATIKLMDTAATELECFKALQKQEQLAASYRINGIREEVQKQKELERTLQGRYGDLVAELERVQSLMEKYRVQAQKEEEIAAKNRALELAEAEEGKTVVPSTETPVPIASDEQHGSSVPVGPTHDENEGQQMDASRSPKTDMDVDIEKEHETPCIDTTVPDNGPEGSDIKLSESERIPGGVLDTVVENDKMITNSVDDAAGDSSTSTEVAKEVHDIEDQLNVLEAGKLDGVLTKQEDQVSEASGNDDFGSGDAMQVSDGK